MISIQGNLYNLLLAHVYGSYRVIDAKVFGSGKAGEGVRKGQGFRIGGREPVVA